MDTDLGPAVKELIGPAVISAQVVVVFRKLLNRTMGASQTIFVSRGLSLVHAAVRTDIYIHAISPSTQKCQNVSVLLSIV